MPITKSAKKALRGSQKKRVINLRRSTELKKAMKSLAKFVAEKKTDEAKAFLPKAYKAIDKAAKKGIIKANTASRRKSRVARMAGFSK